MVRWCKFGITQAFIVQKKIRIFISQIFLIQKLFHLKERFSSCKFNKGKNQLILKFCFEIRVINKSFYINKNKITKNRN